MIPAIFEARGVASNEEDEGGRFIERFEGLRSTGVEDESRRSVNDRTAETVDDRSVRERAEAFDLDLVCGMRGLCTLSGASSKVSYSHELSDAT